MTAVFGKDGDKAQAVTLRKLLIRVVNGEGEDRKLDDDIRNAFALPHTIGDPTSCMDCALSLAVFLRFSQWEALAWATDALRQRVRGGWKNSGQIDGADVARAITAVVLKGQIARLERAPV